MENVIELKGVHKSFGSFQLTDMNLTVKKGFITGFIGGNGVGKSTTINLMMNLLQPDKGDVKVFGLEYKQFEKEIKQRIGFVFDENVYYEHITLAQLRKLLRPAYRNWDDALFDEYVRKFELPLKKKLRHSPKAC